MFELPLTSSRILVFSDFNCPYCFTLSEWIGEMNASHLIRWVGIEHRPDLPEDGGNCTTDTEQLKREVEDILRRAPEVRVQLPPTWCNSRRALMLQNAVEVDLPEQAGSTRLEIFRSYWHHGSALSTWPARAEVEFDEEVESEELARLTAWWRTNVDRIPAMFAPTGASYLGLQDRASARRFLNSALESSLGPGCS